MEYVELLRVRRALVSYAVALAFCFVVVTIVLHGHGGVHIVVDFGKGGVNVGDLLLGGGFGALFLATMFAGNLAGDAETLPLLWTKPVSRTVLAARFVAIDVLGLLAGIVLVAAASVAVIAGLGKAGTIHFSGGDPAGAALALGAPLAWYGITLLATSRLGPGGIARAGALVWPVFIVIVLLGTVTLPPPAHALALGLEHLDPLAYLLGDQPRGSGLLGTDLAPRAAACWAIAVIAIAAAIRLWSTREA